MGQTVLFDEEKYSIVLDDLPYNDVTFKGGRADHIHQWFRLTPSFSPKLVHYMKRKTNTTKEHAVLDPFSGAGTTAIECKKEGINCVGIDINPIFVKVGQAALKWDLNLNRLVETKSKIFNMYDDLTTGIDKIELDTFCMEYGVKVPTIHNPTRWWREDVLKRLLLLKKIIYEIPDSDIRHFYYVGLLAKVVDLANVHRRHPTLTFTDRSTDIIDVRTEIYRHLNIMIEDIKKVQQIEKPGKAYIIEGNSTELSKLNLPIQKFDRVITSPPYPNRYSYVWDTRPHLYFGDIYSKAHEAAALDKLTIGGTWGSATSDLASCKIEPVDKAVDSITSALINEIRIKDNLMANYVLKYFNMMYLHLKDMRNVLNDNSTCCYVVGNSRIKNVDVYTDILLADMFESLDFHVDEIIRVRKRIGRKKLYEAIVVATK